MQQTAIKIRYRQPALSWPKLPPAAGRGESIEVESTGCRAPSVAPVEIAAAPLSASHDPDREGA
jgi:hypothetical protein